MRDNLRHLQGIVIQLQPKITDEPESRLLWQTKSTATNYLSLSIQDTNMSENFNPYFFLSALSICSAAGWRIKCLCSCISVFESVQADGEVVRMVEEASPVWCSNGLVTKNHNEIMK